MPFLKSNPISPPVKKMRKKVDFFEEIIEKKESELTLDKPPKQEFDYFLNKINTRSPYKFLKKREESFFKNVQKKLDIENIRKHSHFNPSYSKPNLEDVPNSLQTADLMIISSSPPSHPDIYQS